MLSFISLDTETTGFSPVSNEIIQIGACRVENGIIAGSFCEYVKTQVSIPADVQQLTGIRNEDVADANSIGEVLQEFIDFCGDLPFLAHNLQFDYSFLHEKSKLCGLERELTMNGERQGICTLALSRKLAPNVSHKLASMVEYFGIQKPDGSFHNAYYDAYMTKQLYSAMCHKYGSMPDVKNPVSLSRLVGGRAVNGSALPFE